MTGHPRNGAEGDSPVLSCVTLTRRSRQSDVVRPQMDLSHAVLPDFARPITRKFDVISLTSFQPTSSKERVLGTSVKKIFRTKLISHSPKTIHNNSIPRD